MSSARLIAATLIWTSLGGCTGSLPNSLPSTQTRGDSYLDVVNSPPLERIRIGPTRPSPEPMIVTEKPKGRSSSESNTCDLNDVETGPISLESVPGVDPDTLILNSRFTFKTGEERNAFGKMVPFVDIKEMSEIGSRSDWILKMANDVATLVSARLPQTCTDAVTSQHSNVATYNPPTGVYEVTGEKRHCASTDWPCGASCKNVLDCRVQMCRAVSRMTLFSKTTRVEYQPQLSLSGEGRDRKVQVNLVITKQDISTSSGEVYKLLENLGVWNAIRFVMPGMAQNMGQSVSAAQVLNNHFFQRRIPSGDYIYLPNTTSVKWGQAPNRPPDSAPFSMIFEKESRLPKDLGCDLAKCVRSSRDTGVLAINECFI